MYFLMILSGFLFFSCDNDDYPHAKVPSIVLNEFWARFPHATDVEFMQSGNNYEVDFELDENDAGALITLSGTLLREKKEISLSELPGAIQHRLNEYGKNKIKDPEIVTFGKEIFYQVQVKRFWSDKKIVLNQLGLQDTTLNYWD